MTAAAELLLRACEQAGAIRAGSHYGRLFRAVAGLWPLDSRADWRPRLTWLLDLVMDGSAWARPRRNRRRLAEPDSLSRSET